MSIFWPSKYMNVYMISVKLVGIIIFLKVRLLLRMVSFVC